MATLAAASTRGKFVVIAMMGALSSDFYGGYRRWNPDKPLGQKPN
jgi:hypothetical protein